MSKETQAISHDVGQLAEDARALMAATADVAGEKVGEARKRLAAALESGKEIAGTFNDWHPTTKSMRDSGNGHWLKEAFLRPGSYEYCLVVDDEWMADPLAKDQVPNSFGGTNSILTVANPQCAAAHADN